MLVVMLQCGDEPHWEEDGMRSSTGAWVTGDDFVGRERELEVLGPLVRSFNHVLLTGQRRMGKTSIARELGRRLCSENRQFIFIDVEEAATVEDVIALLASGMRKVVPLGARWKKLFGHAWTTYIEEVELYDFSVRFRAQVHSLKRLMHRCVHGGGIHMCDLTCWIPSLRGERKGIRSVWIQGNLIHRAWLPGVCWQWGQASIWLGSRVWPQCSAIMTCKDVKALLQERIGTLVGLRGTTDCGRPVYPTPYSGVSASWMSIRL